jgi:hypothetical protein
LHLNILQLILAKVRVVRPSYVLYDIFSKLVITNPPYCHWGFNASLVTKAARPDCGPIIA